MSSDLPSDEQKFLLERVLKFPRSKRVLAFKGGMGIWEPLTEYVDWACDMITEGLETPELLGLAALVGTGDLNEFEVIEALGKVPKGFNLRAPTGDSAVNLFLLGFPEDLPTEEKALRTSLLTLAELARNWKDIEELKYFEKVDELLHYLGTDAPRDVDIICSSEVGNDVVIVANRMVQLARLLIRRDADSMFDIQVIWEGGQATTLDKLQWWRDTQ